MSNLPLILGLALLLVGGVAFVLVRRLQERKALEQHLTRLERRLQKPFSETLQSRSQQILRSMQQLSEQVRRGEAGREQVEQALPRLTQQVVRLEQDQLRLKETESVQLALTEWISKLEPYPRGSEFADLRQVAQNALRITLGLVEEGSAQRAREVAQEALLLLGRQHDAIQISLNRLRELSERIVSGMDNAESCNAEILLRAQWDRALRMQRELDLPLTEGRPSDALVIATRLVSHLEQLQQDLLEVLSKQVGELRIQASGLLNELLIWPPGREEGRVRIQGVLRAVDPSGNAEPRTLLDARLALESAHQALETGREMLKVHEQAWRSYVSGMRERLEQQALGTRLKRYRSLPEDMIDEARAIKKLRQHIELRLESAIDWQVADGLAEVLERESLVLDRLDALEAAIETDLKGLEQGFERLSRFAPQVGLETTRVRRIELILEGIIQKRDRRDLASLLDEIHICDGTLRRTIEESRTRGLEAARQASEGMRKVLERLDREGLASYVPEEHQQLGAALEKALQSLEAREVLEALQATDVWGKQAPRLLETALWRRAEQRYQEGLVRLEPPEELLGLPADAQEEFRSDLKGLRERMETIRRSASTAEELEREVQALQPDVHWLQLRIRKELSRRFQAVAQRHRELIERLGRGTVQFYLPEGSIELLSQGRKLQSDAAKASKGEGLETIELLNALMQHAQQLDALWLESLPRARRFYERQLGTLEVELLEVDATDLPPVITLRRKGLEARIHALLEALQGEQWEEQLALMEPLALDIRGWIEASERTRGISRWWQGQATSIRERLESLRAAGCHVEGAALGKAIQALEQGLLDPSGGETVGGSVPPQDGLPSETRAAEAGVNPVPPIEVLEKQLRQEVTRADAALAHALEDVARSRVEQDQITRWEQILSSRKQDLDWLRSCLKGIMSPSPEGLDLKEGLGTLQRLSRSLEPIALDLEAAAKHDASFRAWVAGVRARAEKQFRGEFQEVIASLHELPAEMSQDNDKSLSGKSKSTASDPGKSDPSKSVPIKSLCAEALAHIDAVLSTHISDDTERELYQNLQRRGDAFHRLFGKKLSVR